MAIMNALMSAADPPPSPAAAPSRRADELALRRCAGRRAVIVGSGFGGLAAAVRLLARGWAVDVLEALPQVGGRARVFTETTREGTFSFDAGPTVITAPFLFDELWALLGEQVSDHVTMVPVDPFYRIRFDDGSWFDYTGDAERMRAEVEKVSPSDVAGYERFVAQSEKIFDVGFTQLAHKSFARARDMIKIVPAMMKLQSYRSVHGLAAHHVKSEKLRQVLSFHPLLVGGNPFDTTSIYSLILYLERRFGVHFPKGGTGALVRGLVALIERHGGRVWCNQNVARIVVEQKRARGVQMADGRRIEADIVVSNADAATTYRRLVDPAHRRRWTDQKLARAKYSMGLFVWYFGTRKRYDDVAHHSILLGPRYEPLLSDIFKNKVLADDCSLYLHRPAASDPGAAPAGCDAFYVLSPVPHLHDGPGNVDWPQRAEAYRHRLQARLKQTVLPDLDQTLCCSRVLTPQHFADELQSLHGAAFSLAPTLRQSAYFRPHNVSEDIDKLYLVGAGTHPGAGLPGVLSSARVLDEVVGAPAA